MQKNKITHLKIKIKYLAAEAGIIKLEERKALKEHKRRNGGSANVECYGVKTKYGVMHGSWGQPFGDVENYEGCRCQSARYQDLRSHRHGIVGYESRHNLLAYGFLRGRSYARMENKCAEDNEPDFDKVKKLAKRFNPGIEDFTERWDEWLAAAEKHLYAKPVAEVEDETPEEPEPAKVVAPEPQAKQPQGLIAKVIAAVKG